MTADEKPKALAELYQKLAESEQQSQAKAPTISHKNLMNKMRSKINGDCR